MRLVTIRKSVIAWWKFKALVYHACHERNVKNLITSKNLLLLHLFRLTDMRNHPILPSALVELFVSTGDRWLLLRVDLYLQLNPLWSRHHSFPRSNPIKPLYFWLSEGTHAVGGGAELSPQHCSSVRFKVTVSHRYLNSFLEVSIMVADIQYTTFSARCLESKCSSVKHLLSVRGNAILICVIVQQRSI